jgi:putative membrane protein
LVAFRRYERSTPDGILAKKGVKTMYWRIYEHGMEFGWFFIAVFVILMFLGIVYLVNLFPGRRREIHGESPVHILKRRYAKGEITKEEFEKMKEELTSKIC